MKITTLAIRVWRMFSMIAVFVVSVYSYSLFSEDVGVHFDAAGKADEFIRKSEIFYIIVGLILVNNVLLLALGRQLLKIPNDLLPIPNRVEWAAQRDELNEHLRNWIYSLVAMINTLVGMTVFALATVNNEFTYKISAFEGLLYLVVGFLCIILIALPIRLMIKPKLED
ncbi:hypothetical protein [Runella sp.]|jgi:uncharacterized membrane protein|uniref:hypothetical protein n=1 Tax=Runella sp. TaxID=1960881 RepID=UPI0026050F44|nr:hypothetical protein [Runella sp.]